MRMLFRTIFPLPVICLIGACSNVASIQVDDSTSFNNIEASIPFAHNDSLRIRLRGSVADGEFNQSIPSGELIRLENTPFFGPIDISGTVDVNYWSIAIGEETLQGGFKPGEVGFMRYLGIAQTNFDLKVQNAGTTFLIDDSTTELYLQFGFSYVVSDSFSAGLTYAISTGSDSSYMQEIDLLMELELARQLRLTGGYRWYDFAYEQVANDSRIEIDLRGPFIGVKLPF